MGIMEKKMETTIYCLGFRVEAPLGRWNMGYMGILL